MLKKIIFIFIVLISFVHANENFEAGVDFELMNNNPSDFVTKKTDKILVVEAFWYGCPHCYIFLDYLSKWQTKKDKDIEFLETPAVFNKTWLLHARAFYTMKELDNFSELHKNFFYAYHEQQRTFNSIESIMKFFDSQGVDIVKAKNIISSEEVSKKVQKANYTLETYNIDSVPAMIINNKYKITGRMAKTYDRMIEISDYIVDLERKNRAK